MLEATDSALKNRHSSPQHELAMVIFESGALHNTTGGQMWSHSVAFSNISVFL